MLQTWIYVLLVTPCLLTRIREFIHETKCWWSPYPKQTKGNEFISCSNDVCHILKRSHSFKTPAIPFILPKPSYKLNVVRPHRRGKESGRRPWSPLWRHQWRSFLFISHADDVKRLKHVYISRLLAHQKRESAPSMGYVCLYIYIYKYIYIYIYHEYIGNIRILCIDMLEYVHVWL